MTKTMKTLKIYYIFWALIHSMITLFQFIYRLFKKLFKTDIYFERDFNKLFNNLNKIPKHIAICLNEDNTGQQLSQVIHWCRLFGCRYVSLFSDNDIFVSLTQLEKQLIRSSTNGHKEGSEERLRHPKNGFNGQQMNGKGNHFISLEDINVCVVRREDSHQSIVNAAKHLSGQKAPIDQNDITLYLKKTFAFPDPELMLAFGRSSVLYGYPIWQLRLTEIYFIPTLWDFTFSHFYEVLTKYSKCEQRLGK